MGATSAPTEVECIVAAVEQSSKIASAMAEGIPGAESDCATSAEGLAVSSSADAPVDPFLMQRQALRAAAREAALEDALRRRQLAEASPSKTISDNAADCRQSPSRSSPNKITHDSVSSGRMEPFSGDAAGAIVAVRSSPTRPFSARVVAPAVTSASAKTWSLTCDSARRGREVYEQLEEASNGLCAHLEDWTHLSTSQSEPPTSGTVTPTAPSECDSSASAPVRSSFAPSARRPTSSWSDTARASPPLGGSRKGKGGTPRRCPGLGVPTRRIDPRRLEEYHCVAPLVAADRGAPRVTSGHTFTSPCKLRGDGHASVASPLNSPGHQVEFGSSLSPSRVFMAASPVRPTAGKRWLDDAARQGTSAHGAYKKGSCM